MNNILKTEEYKNLSKAEVIRAIREMVNEELRLRIKDNYSDEDFNNPSWHLRQAANGGIIKFCNKLLTMIPDREN